MMREIQLHGVRDDRGSLKIAESGVHVPFEIRRVFTISDCEDARGGHAHRKCHQLIICPLGSFRLFVIDAHGKEQEKWVTSWRDDMAHHVPPMHWLTLSGFEPKTVVVVLCSHLYDESDYITNYEELRRLGQV